MRFNLRKRRRPLRAGPHFAAVLLVEALTLGTVAAPASAVARPAAPASRAIEIRALTQDARWIESATSVDGAIATNADRRLVWPYGANFAAMGLARAAAAGDHLAARVAWRWLDWYQAHEDVQGFVSNYYRAGSVLASNGTMDSTDAYAGTFLMAVGDLFAATLDQRRLSALHRGIAGAVHAIESTQDTDGLTWAKPSSHVKYLMDQAETYAGLVAASRIARSLDDDGLSVRAALDATRLRAGVEKLWNPRVGAYDWAVHGDGAHATTNWSVLYPDAMEQAWAVSFGLVDASRARALLDRLTHSQPFWATPGAIARFDNGSHSVGYWPVAAWGLSSHGHDASRPLRSMRSAAFSSHRTWPFTSAVAGQLMVAESPPIPPPAVSSRIRSVRRC